MTETIDSKDSLSPEARALGGRFRVERRLGAGGMGVVYKAFDERRGMEVALKTLQKLSPEGAMLLKREFRIAAQLRHPNLVRFFDLIVTPDACFFSMELISGQDLITFVRGTGEDTPTLASVDMPTTGPGTRPGGSTAAVWFREEGATYDGSKLLLAFPQICAALDVLHQGAVVHRDLKPGNILVSQEGAVKLLDFGIAQSFTLAEEEGPPLIITGTPHYMSPEQARGERVGPASDMYSLGIILYIVLAGRPPFMGQSTRQILRGHAIEPPLPPSHLATGIPRELERLCLELLHKNPRMRPSARETAERLCALGAPSAPFGRQRPRRFVGRGAEIEALWQRAREVREGATRGVVFSGESGAGKSALCEEGARRLSAEGWRVLSGRCYEREEIPYNALDPLIDAVASSLRERPLIEEALPVDIELLARMFPSLLDIPGVSLTEENLGAEESRRRAKVALRGLFSLFAQQKPLLLWVDDLQWADADSFDLLGSLFSGEEGAFLFLGTCRSRERLASFLALPEVSCLSLRPFGEEEVGALLGGEAPLSLIERIAKEAHGNAFLAVELAQASAEGETQAGQLSALLAARISLLSREPRLVLQALSAAGSSSSFAALGRVTALGSSALSQALDDLQGERWLKEVDHAGGEESAYDMYHDRIREVVYESLPTGRRKELHGVWGEALMEGGEPESVAGHFLRAGRAEEGARWLLRAAQKAAQQLAVDRADELYLRAVKEGGLSPEEAKAAREERALVLDRAGGRYVRAASAYREAAQHAEGGEAVRLLLRAAETDLKRGKVDAAMEACVRAMAPYEALSLPSGMMGAMAESTWRTMEIEWRLRRLTKLPGRQISEHDALRHLLYHRLGATLVYFDLPRSLVFAMRSLSIALSRGSDEEVVDALALYSLYVAIRRGRKNLARGQELYERCYRWRHAVHDPEIEAWIEMTGAILAAVGGRYEDACCLLPPALEAYRRLGYLGGPQIMVPAMHLASALSARGRPGEGLEILTPLFARVLDLEDHLSLTTLIPRLVWLRLLTGDMEGARFAAGSLLKENRSASVFAVDLSLCQAALLLASGKRAAALAILERLTSNPVQSGVAIFVDSNLRACVLLGCAHLAEARQAPSRPARLLALRKALSAIRPVVRSDDPVWEGIGFRLAGLIEEARGDGKKARLWLDRAVQSLSEQGEAVELAAALLARGALTGETKDTARGRAILEEGGFLDPALREGGGWESGV